MIFIFGHLTFIIYINVPFRNLKPIFISCVKKSILTAMDTKIYLAPMSGVTDLAFRLICRKAGAGHCFYEMIDSHAMVRNHPKSRRLLKTVKEDSPISAQLVGSDPDIMLEAAERIISLADISFLDINSACPAKKVVKKGDGAALLKNKTLLAKIIKKLSSALRVPVTVKLRTGFNTKDAGEFVDIARLCEASGASTLFIHGRTYAQGYSGDIDYESIRAAKEAVKIPVFGSGNIFDAFTAKKMCDETGCDGIMVARGALGNPWIFKDIENYLKKGLMPEKPKLSLKKAALKEHLAYIEKYNDIPDRNKAGIRGKIATWYIKSVFNAKRLRDNIYRTKSLEELIDLINSIKK